MANSNNPPKKSRRGKPKKLKLRSRDRGDVEASLWRNLQPDHVLAMIDQVTASGGAIMFTRSSDGGALGVRVYHDDYELETLWGNDRGDMQEVIEDIWENFRGGNDE